MKKTALQAIALFFGLALTGAAACSGDGQGCGGGSGGGENSCGPGTRWNGSQCVPAPK